MRGLALVLTAGTILYVGCSGESSSLMSAWNDNGGSQAGGASAGGGSGGGWSSGGAAGQPTYLGGSGGWGGSWGGGWGGSAGGSAGGSVGGVVYVPGGMRDVTTAMCTVTSGGTCPVRNSDVTCLESSCRAELSQCYTAAGTGPQARAISGDCLDYANCLLAGPCDSGRDNWERKCTSAYVIGDCSMCLYNLAACASFHGCSLSPTCSTAGGTGGTWAAGGAAGYFGQAGSAGWIGSSGGAAGATAYPPPIPVDAGPYGPIIKLDAGPYYPRDARGIDVWPPTPITPDAGFWATPDARKMDGGLVDSGPLGLLLP